MAITGNEFLDRALSNLPYALIPGVGVGIAGLRTLTGAGQPKPPAPTGGAGGAGGQTTQSSSGSTGQIEAGDPTLPPKQGLPAGGVGGGSLNDAIAAVIKFQGAETEAARKFYPERAALDQQYWEKRQAILDQTSLEKMAEKTRRDVELQTIDAWQKVTSAGITRDALLATGMMQLSATLGMPNPNVLAAGANLAQIGASAFKPGQAVF